MSPPRIVPVPALSLLLSPILLVACGGPGPAPDPGPGAPSPAAARPLQDPPVPGERDLPEGWRTVPMLTFEGMVDELAAAPPFVWSPAARGELTPSLDRPGQEAVRAAVLLAHSSGPRAVEILVGRLERRQTAPSRALDAGDIVAAGALAGRGLGAGIPARLEALAVGGHPHPDLEVRVECARGALAAGREGVVPFLLRVLRALTPAERDDPPDWERVSTLAWAKNRAAEALSSRAGVPCAFRPDGSWADQMAEADHLQALLSGN